MKNYIIEYLNKYIIGQEKLKPELARFLLACLDGENFNFLLIGPSGYGKSHVAKIMYNILGLKDTVEYDPENLNIKDKYRIKVIDEIHLLKNQEVLYPKMDIKKYIFILSTNLPGLLKEPLLNRCITFHLMAYTDQELGEIIKQGIRLRLPDNYYNILGSVSRGNPRTAKLIGTRVRLLIRNKGIPKSENELVNLLDELYINQGGYTPKDLIYLEFLERVKIASIKTISGVTKLDENTIKNDIEPFLINKGRVKITPRGRILCQ